MPEQSQFRFAQPAAGPTWIDIADAELSFYERAFSVDEADRYLRTLMAETPWRRDHITIHGRTIPLPRLQTWYADDGATLNYSGLSVPACAWTRDLVSIRDRVTELTGLRFNGVLLNCYRDGNDSVGWHSDNEAEWGPNPVIASVSFGATRDFMLKHLTLEEVDPVRCVLSHGSLLVMGDGVQTHWQHQLPKRKRVTEPRINLTFRNRV